jgi:outer membrane lipoprotein-sorting protein
VTLFRRLSTRSLVLLLGAAAALSGGGAAIAVAAGGSGPTPPPKPLAAALHDALAAPPPAGITARVKFTNNLFPSGALLGPAGSALMSGASGRLWLTNDGRGRVELQSDAGDVQIVWNQSVATVYDESSNTVYRFALPKQKQDSGTEAKHPAPSVGEISSFLDRLGTHVTVTGAQPTNVGHQPAYSVSASPKHDGGLLGSLQLAWDAARGVPLRVAVYAQGSAAPALAFDVTDISYGAVAASDVAVSPPAGAKVVDLGTPTGPGKDTSTHTSASGLAAVQKVVSFPVVAPATLVGLPRQDVRAVGTADSKAALVTYGRGLGGVVVVERKVDPGRSSGNGGILSSLPKISLDGITAHELATQLGTAIEWRNGGVDFVLAGSVPSAAAEAAARALR